jgi:hypothetical protein
MISFTYTHERRPPDDSRHTAIVLGFTILLNDSSASIQTTSWREAGLHCRNAPPFFASDLQGSLIVDSARLQREYWSRNTENQNESLSAEFQQGQSPTEIRKRSAFILD